MRGDFSRLPAAGGPYARVLMQQGRLQTDADLNALAGLAAEAHAAALRDLVGPAGGPADAGFGLRGHGGYRFDGSGRGAVIHRPRDRRVHGAFTLEGWVRLDNEFAGGMLVERAHGPEEGRGGAILAVNGAGRLHLRLREHVRVEAGAVADGVVFEELIEDDAEVHLTAEREVARGRYVHVAAVVGGSRVRLYVDGELAAERDGGTPLPFPAAPVRVGRDWRGVIDQLHLWPVEFGPELLRLRASGAPIAELVDGEPIWRLGDVEHAVSAARGEHDGHTPPAHVAPELTLSAGRYYLDGLASRLERDAPLAAQPEGPGVTIPPAALRERAPGPWLAWLEACEVVVTAHEDPAMRDPAFGDADTSARLRTVSRARIALGEPAAALARAHPPAGALAIERVPGAPLGEPGLARVEIHDAGFASLPLTAARPAEGFALVALSHDGWATLGDHAFGHEALWRPGRPVELLEAGAGRVVAARVAEVASDAHARTRLRLHADEGERLPVAGEARDWRLLPIATFKWSRDNAAYAARVIGFEGEDDGVLHLDDLAGGDALAAGDVVEIGDLELTLRRRAAPLRHVTDVDLTEAEDALRVTLDSPALDPLEADRAARLARAPVLRHWDRVEGAAGGGVVYVTTAHPIRLGHGLQARFTAGYHQSGEAWTCGVRDGLEWPVDARGVAEPRTAAHGRVRHAPIASVVFDGAQVEVRDLRRLFAPLAHPPRWETVRLTRDAGEPGEEVEVEAVELSDPAVEVAAVELAPAPRALPEGCCVLTRRVREGGGLRFTGAHLARRRTEPRWARLPVFPPFAPAAMATLGGWPMLLGRDGELALLDVEAGAWELREPMALTGFDAASTAVLDGALHVLGWDGAYARTWHLRYDAARDSWEERAPLPGARRRFCVAAARGRLYAAGGFLHPSKAPCEAFDAYDPEEDRWSRRPKLPHPVARAALVGWEGRLHLLGGVGGRPAPMEPVAQRRTAVFSPTYDCWIEGPPLPNARADAVAVAADSRIHVFGGEGESGRPATAEVLDPVAMAWMEQPQPGLAGPLAATIAHGAIHLVSTAPDAVERGLEVCTVDDIFYVHELDEGRWGAAVGVVADAAFDGDAP